MREQGILLKYGIQIALIGWKVSDIPAFENDLTFVGSLETAQNTEGCSLSAATGSQQCQELIFADVQIEIIQNHLIVK